MFGNSYDFDSDSRNGKMSVKKLRWILGNYLRIIIPVAIVLVALGGVLLIVWLNSPEKHVDTEESKKRGSAESPALEITQPEVTGPTTYAEAIFQSRRDGETPDRVRLWMKSLMDKGPTEEDRAAALLWLADDILDSLPSVPAMERADLSNEAERYLKRAIVIGPKNEAAHDTLARHYLRLGRRGEAIDLLGKVVRDFPGLGTLLAEGVDVNRKQAEQIGPLLEGSLAHWREATKKDLTDIRARVQLAVTQVLLGDDAPAMAILDEHPVTEKHERDSLYDELEVSLRIRQTIRALRQRPPNVEDAVDHLEEALTVAPDDYRAILWLSDLGVNGAAFRPRISAFFQKIAEREQAVWRIHLALGLQYLPDEDYTTASLHFARAYALHPGDPVLANNHAWCLANRDDPQLEEALRVLDRVVKENENFSLNPEVKATRGKILVRLGIKQMNESQQAQFGTKRRGRELIIAHTHRSHADLFQGLPQQTDEP